MRYQNLPHPVVSVATPPASEYPEFLSSLLQHALHYAKSATTIFPSHTKRIGPRYRGYICVQNRVIGPMMGFAMATQHPGTYNEGRAGSWLLGEAFAGHATQWWVALTS